MLAIGEQLVHPFKKPHKGNKNDIASLFQIEANRFHKEKPPFCHEKNHETISGISTPWGKNWLESVENHSKCYFEVR